jgi:hypothetical protein
MYNYNVHRGSINTGDIILFSGKGRISNIIKWITKSKWSHVGVAIKIKELDMILCLESTTLVDVPDYETGATVKGVQITNLSERILKYDGDVVVRHLVDINRDQVFSETLEKFKKEHRNKAYERHCIELFNAAYDGVLGQNKEDLSSLFCSELVAELYQQWGLLSDKIPSNEYTPKDFSTNGNINLLNGRLTEEITLRG